MQHRDARRGALTLTGAAIIGVVALVALFVIGFVPRLAARRTIEVEAAAASTKAPVFTAIARTGSAASSLSLPGTVQAMHETQVYARTSGYVKRWLTDIGTRVRVGQVLAELESPELTQELMQAQAAAAQTRATATFARNSFERWKSLERDSAVSRQELDEKTAAFEATAAAAEASQANVRRLGELRGFTRIVAPFSGIVTARNVDVGTLVQPGAGGAPTVPGAARGLFAVAQTDTVRVYVNVPESYASAIVPGSKVDVKLGSLPLRTFHGTVARSAQVVDPASRTLLVEVTVPNRDHTAMPGSSATVSFQLSRAAAPVIIPANTLMVGAKGTRVATVSSDTLVFATVELGRDYGDSVEVLSGLRAGQQLVVNPGDELVAGMRLRTAPVPKEK